MRYRTFANQKVAEVGLGTWQLGGSDWGDLDESKAMDILNAYVDAGGNLIDTADVYGMGTSERIIGKFLETRQDELFVASKLGRRSDNGAGWPQNFTYEWMRKHTLETLENLSIDQLWLQQLHCVDREALAKGNVFEHLRKLQTEGLIKHWGASVESIEEAKICLEQEGIASLQVIFNIFRQHLADELFELAKQKEVALIIRVPLASGLLSGKFTSTTTFASNDHRNYNANGELFNVGETFSGIPFAKGVELVDKVKVILPEGNMVLQALRWILDHPEVTTVIPGASNKKQVLGNVESSEMEELPKAVHNNLRELYNKEIRNEIRGEI